MCHDLPNRGREIIVGGSKQMCNKYYFYCLKVQSDWLKNIIFICHNNEISIYMLTDDFI